MELQFEQIRKYWEVRHQGQRIQARDKVSVCCVLHGEKHPSCTLFLTGNGGFNCHSCGAKGSVVAFEMQFSKCDAEAALKNIAQITGASLNVSDKRDTRSYLYFDREGNLIAKKVRYQKPDGAKGFYWWRWEANKWEIGLSSDPPPPLLYNEPQLVTARMILYVEGEKCADAVRELIPQLWPKRQAAGLSIAVTTSPHAASQPGAKQKWHERFNRQFSCKHVVIFEDNDAAGQALADHVSEQISPFFADSVRRITFADKPAKYDIADWIEENKADPEKMIAELQRMIESAPLWKPEATPSHENCLVDAVEFAESEAPEIDWLIDGVIQRDANGIIAAEPKTGKSLAALDLLLSLACGTRWLGRAIPHRTRCAYISREDSPLLTRTRIAGFLRGKGLPVDPTGWLWCNTRDQLADFSIENDEHLACMAHDLKERGVQFAILDVLYCLHARNENDNTEMAQVLKRVKQLGHEAGCSIGLIHHVSKENSGGRFFTRIRGASAIHGWTEWSIGLTLENPGDAGKKKLIRRAEFETKAGQECDPISFTVEFENSILRLQTIDGNYQQPGANGKPYWQ